MIKEMDAMIKNMKTEIKILEQDLQKTNPIELVKRPNTIFTKFDQKIWDENQYYLVHNWVLIASMGDPKTWGGKEVVAVMSKGEDSGLAGSILDLSVIQEILYMVTLIPTRL